MEGWVLGAIIGGAVVFVILLGVGVYFCYRCYKKKDEARRARAEAAGLGVMQVEMPTAIMAEERRQGLRYSSF